jgi:tape measure domain-containing protein
MAIEVDAIIGELELRYQKYVDDANRVIATNRALRQSMIDAGGDDRALDQSAERVKRNAKVKSDAEKQAASEIARAAKETAAAEKAAAKEGADAVKQAAREKVAAEKAAAREIAAAQREAARETAAQQRAFYAAGPKIFEAKAREYAAAERERAARIAAPVTGPAYGPPRPINIVEPGTGKPQLFGFGNQVPPVSDRPLPIGRAASEDAGAAAAKAEAAAVREINQAEVDLLGIQARVSVARGVDRQALQDEAFAIQQMTRYQAQGLGISEAAVKVEDDLAARTTYRTEQLALQAKAQSAALERQIAAQSKQVAGGISLFTGALVGGLTVGELSHLNDEYIRFSNSLKVAGVSALAFDGVQEHLLQTSVRTGTNIGALSDTYRSISLASHDLGASQEDILRVSDAVANSLKITGASGGAARAAILQLGHAFETGKVTAREFNGLALNAYPILQAAAAGSDKYGGSVAKLRAALIAGDLTSKEFFADVLAGSDQLAARAAKGSLTTAQGFTALNNALVVYFGTADKAGGVSAAFGATLGKLAANLDVVIPAIAAIGVGLGAGYVSRAIAAGLATETFAAKMALATTTMARAGVVAKGAGSALLGAFGGPLGLTITAITLGIGAFYSEISRHDAVITQVNESFDQMQDRLQAVGAKAGLASSHTAGVGDAAKSAAPGVEFLTGKVRGLADELYRQADAAKQARIETARNAVKDAEKQEQAAAQELPQERYRTDTLHFGGPFNPQNYGQYLRSTVGGLYNFFNGGVPDAKAKQAYAQARTVTVQAKRDLSDAYQSSNGTVSEDLSPTAQAAVRKLQKQIDDLKTIRKGTDGKRFDKITAQIQKRQQQIDALNTGADPAAAAASTYVPGRGRTGPTAETLAKRAENARLKGIHDDEAYTSDLKQARDRELQAQADLSESAEQRADLERQRVRDAAAETAKNIRAKGPKDPKLNGGVAGTGERDGPETNNLLGINDRTVGLNIDKIDRDERRRLIREANDLSKIDLENQRDQLQAQGQLAETTEARRRNALQLLDLEYKIKEADLRATLGTTDAATVEHRIAQKQLDALPGQKADDERSINRQNEGAGASYLRSLNVDKQQFIQSEEVKALEAFNTGLDDSVKKALHLHGIFGDIIGDLIDMAIKQALIKPLAGSLFGGSGGGGSGGGLGGLFGSVAGIFGGGHTLGGSSISGDLFSLLSHGNGVSGARAAGGPVSAGGTYLVGEKGPEIVKFGANGTVFPNGISANTQVNSAAPQIQVLAPRHYDLSNSLIDRDTLAQMNAENRAYTDAVGRAAYGKAVQTAAGQAPGVIRQGQVLKG